MEEVKLHLGCGAIIIPGWLNYDLEPGPGGMRRDLTQPFPVASDSVDFIFNEHFLEHIPRPAGVGFLRECRRVLKPGGVLRVVTPDLGHLVEAWQCAEVIKIPGVWEPITVCQMFNEGMRLWGHQFVYDFQELASTLRAAGFHEIYAKPYTESPYDALKCIDQRPHHGELIFEAAKQSA